MPSLADRIVHNITRKSPLPLYFQLKEEIKKLIEKNVLKQGDKLPAERDFTKSSMISRMTTKHAYDELVKEGKIIRLHGKGSFVFREKTLHDILMLDGFTKETKKRGLKPSTVILDIKTVVPAPEIAVYLNLKKNEEVYKIKRLRSVNNEPIAVECCFVPKLLFPNLEKNNDLSSLYKIFAEKFNTHISRAEQTIKPVKAEGETSKLLKIKKGYLLLLLKRISYSIKNEPFEYVEGVYNTMKHEYMLEIKR
ncbi:MAG: GntR family transcriptional regulator [Candidatus Firestonebacteria bacterium]